MMRDDALAEEEVVSVDSPGRHIIPPLPYHTHYHLPFTHSIIYPIIHALPRLSYQPLLTTPTLLPPNTTLSYQPYH